LHFDRPKEAWQAISKAGEFVPDGVSPRRMELLNHLVLIATALGDMEQSCTYFETAVASGRALGSDLHQNEAHDLYQHMQAKWPREKRIRTLAELFQQ
jgi:hypothetical protein